LVKQSDYQRLDAEWNPTPADSRGSNSLRWIGITNC